IRALWKWKPAEPRDRQKEWPAVPWSQPTSPYWPDPSRLSAPNSPLRDIPTRRCSPSRDRSRPQNSEPCSKTLHRQMALYIDSVQHSENRLAPTRHEDLDRKDRSCPQKRSSRNLQEQRRQTPF